MSDQQPDSPEPGAPAKSPRPFVALLIGGAAVAIVAFILMNLAFSAGGWLNVVGFVMFAVWIVSLLALVVGVIGAVSHRGK